MKETSSDEVSKIQSVCFLAGFCVFSVFSPAASNVPPWICVFAGQPVADVMEVVLSLEYNLNFPSFMVFLVAVDCECYLFCL